jgi:hypothetical protein
MAVAADTLAAVREVERGVARRRVRFFDGPYWIDFVRETGEACSIVTSTGSSVTGDTTTFARLVRQVESVCRQLLSDCTHAGQDGNDDVRRLTALLEDTSGPIDDVISP